MARGARPDRQVPRRRRRPGRAARQGRGQRRPRERRRAQGRARARGRHRRPRPGAEAAEPVGRHRSRSPTTRTPSGSLTESGEAAVGEVNGWQAVAENEAEPRRPTARHSSRARSRAPRSSTRRWTASTTTRSSTPTWTARRCWGPSHPSRASPARSCPCSAATSAPSALSSRRRTTGFGSRAAPSGRSRTWAPEPFRSELIEEVPAGALAFLSFNGLGEGLSGGAQGLQGLLPFDLNEVAALFAGETAVYVRPGTPEPSITLVTEVDDEAAALRDGRGARRAGRR